MSDTGTYTEDSLQKLNSLIDAPEMIKEIGFRSDSMFFSGNKLYCYCPLDGSTTQGNMEIDLNKKSFFCNTCREKGDLIGLFAKARKITYERSADIWNRKYGNKTLATLNKMPIEQQIDMEPVDESLSLEEMQKRKEGPIFPDREDFCWKLFSLKQGGSIQLILSSEVSALTSFHALISQFTFTFDGKEFFESGSRAEHAPWAVGDFFLLHKTRRAVEFIRDGLYSYIPVKVKTETGVMTPEESLEFVDSLFTGDGKTRIEVDGTEYQPEDIVFDFTRVCREVRREIRVIRDRYKVPEEHIEILTDGETIVLTLLFDLFGATPSRYLPEVFSGIAMEFAEVRKQDGSVVYQESKTADMSCYHREFMRPIVNRSSPWSDRTFVSLGAGVFMRMSSEEVLLASRAPREGQKASGIVTRVSKLVVLYREALRSVLRQKIDLPGPDMVQPIMSEASSTDTGGEIVAGAEDHVPDGKQSFTFWPPQVISVGDISKEVEKRHIALTGLPATRFPNLDKIIRAAPGEVVLVLGRYPSPTVCFSLHLCLDVCVAAEYSLLLFGQEPGPEQFITTLTSLPSEILEKKRDFINCRMGFLSSLPAGEALDTFLASVAEEDSEMIVTGALPDSSAALRFARKLRSHKMGAVLAVPSYEQIARSTTAWEFALGTGTYSEGPSAVVFLDDEGDNQFSARVIRSNLGKPGIVHIRYLEQEYRFEETSRKDGGPTL